MPVASVLEEMRSQPNILNLVKDGNIDADAYPLSIQLLKEFRGSRGVRRARRREDVARLRADEGHRQRLLRGAAGVDGGRPRGRLPARRRTLRARKVLAVGYGSGDAAEAIPMTVAAGWRDAAAKIGFEAALEAHQDLTQQQYETPARHGHGARLARPRRGVRDSVDRQQREPEVQRRRHRVLPLRALVASARRDVPQSYRCLAVAVFSSAVPR